MSNAWRNFWEQKGSIFYGTSAGRNDLPPIKGLSPNIICFSVDDLEVYFIDKKNGGWRDTNGVLILPR